MFDKNEILEIVAKYAKWKKAKKVPVMKRKIRSKELYNLKAKPSDYRPGYYEHQMSIDDLIPKPKYDETLIIRCNENVSPEVFTYWQREFVEQRKKGVILLPYNFEVLGYAPSDLEIKVTNNGEPEEGVVVIDH